MTSVPEFINARQSVRAFLEKPVDADVLDPLIEAACMAPAPHHSRPWRWVAIVDADHKRTLAVAMAARWRVDLQGDGTPPDRIQALVDSSIAKLTGPAALVLGCLTWNGLDRYPDEARQRAEWGMALLSLGAAVENLMLAATEVGLASCWVAAPIFCPVEARDALDLPTDWRPHALVMLGHPDPAYVGRPRPAVPLEALRIRR